MIKQGSARRALSWPALSAVCSMAGVLLPLAPGFAQDAPKPAPVPPEYIAVTIPATPAAPAAAGAPTAPEAPKADIVFTPSGFTFATVEDAEAGAADPARDQAEVQKARAEVEKLRAQLRAAEQRLNSMQRARDAAQRSADRARIDRDRAGRNAERGQTRIEVRTQNKNVDDGGNSEGTPKSSYRLAAPSQRGEQQFEAANARIRTLGKREPGDAMERRLDQMEKQLNDMVEQLRQMRRQTTPSVSGPQGN